MLRRQRQLIVGVGQWLSQMLYRVQVNLATSGFDTLLAVYTGTAVNALTLVGSNDDCATAGAAVTYSCLAVNITPSTTYFVQVDGYSSAKGNAVIALTISGTVVSPPNDLFSNAVTTLPATGSTLGASLETGEPLAGAGASGSVWYRFTAPVTGSVASISAVVRCCSNMFIFSE